MLLKRKKVTAYRGRGEAARPRYRSRSRQRRADRDPRQHILLATGSRSATMRGIEEDGVHIGNSTMALSFDRVPEHLVVIGAGYIGLELGSVWKRLGSRVTVLEALPRIMPGMDARSPRSLSELSKSKAWCFDWKAG